MFKNPCGPTSPHDRYLASFCGEMFYQGAEWLFKAQLADRKRLASATSIPTITATGGSSSSSSNGATPAKPKRSRRTWRMPYAVVQLYRYFFRQIQEGTMDLFKKYSLRKVLYCTV